MTPFPAPDPPITADDWPLPEHDELNRALARFEEDGE